MICSGILSETMFHFQIIETGLRRLNHYLERSMPILTPSGVILGLILGALITWMKPAVPYLFAAITFIGGLGISSNAFVTVIKRPKAIFITLLSTVIIMPLVAWGMANLFFPNQPELITGFILLMSIPTAITGYIWSSIYHGNDALSISLIIITTCLAPIVTPLTVAVLAKTSIEIDTKGLMISMLLMVVIPSLVGILINNMSKGKVTEHIVPSLKPFSKIGLFFIIAINTSQVSERLIADANWGYVPIALSCALLAAIGYPIAHFLGKAAGLSTEEQKSVTFASALRNISSAMVLVIAYFPPQSALPVIFGIVFQQTTCAFMAYALYGRKNPAIK